MPNSNQLVCSNHFQSEDLKNNKRNQIKLKTAILNIVLIRMTQFFAENPKITPQIAFEILRNKDGLNNIPLGYGNEKA